MKLSGIVMTVFSILATAATFSFADINDDFTNAAMVGNLPQVKSLLDQGADVKARHPQLGKTALSLAVMNGHADVVEFLLEHGADVNTKDDTGTALSDAATYGKEDVVKVLLAHGANINAKGGSLGETALSAASRSGYVDIVQILLEHDANINATNALGKTPLTMATLQGQDEVVKVLVAHGAKETPKRGGIESATARVQALAAAYKQAADNATKLKQAQPESGSEETAEGQPSTPKTVQSDVDKPKYTTAENPNNFAVIIGVEKYASLPAAEFAEHDAEAVRANLMALGYPARNIYFLSGQQATRGKIAQSVNTWLPNRVGANSTVFFYYSGHGAPDPKTSQAYLVPVDGDAEDLDSTAYPIKQLYEKLGKLKARHIIVALDSCFSGAGGRSVLAKGTRPLVSSVDLGGVPNNVIALTASDKNQISGTIEDQGHGAFTYYMLKGLAGAAKNDSGHVTVQSLYSYLTPKVQDAARLHNRDQTPQLAPATANAAVPQIQLR